MYNRKQYPLSKNSKSGKALSQKVKNRPKHYSEADKQEIIEMSFDSSGRFEALHSLL